MCYIPLHSADSVAKSVLLFVLFFFVQASQLIVFPLALVVQVVAQICHIQAIQNYLAFV